MIYRLSGSEIITLIAKHAPKDYPELSNADGRAGKVTLYSNSKGEFWCEIKLDEENKDV